MQTGFHWFQSLLFKTKENKRRRWDRLPVMDNWKKRIKKGWKLSHSRRFFSGFAINKNEVIFNKAKRKWKLQEPSQRSKLHVPFSNCSLSCVPFFTLLWLFRAGLEFPLVEYSDSVMKCLSQTLFSLLIVAATTLPCALWSTGKKMIKKYKGNMKVSCARGWCFVFKLSSDLS